MIKEAIGKVILKKDLQRSEIESVMDEIMTGKATPAQISAFLTALRMKGETVEEITGCATIMRKYVRKVSISTPDSENLIDTCGTGGDGYHTFNISTISAFVCAGAGAKVAKHGNRAVSSMCGSADLLKELGINIEASIETVERCIQVIGVGFLFAPLLHPAMKYATPVRREIGIRTIFNILGPLTNPAGAKRQLLGVFDRRWVEPIARVLQQLGSVHSLVVCGDDGLDEVTTCTTTFVAELRDGNIKTYTIHPEDFGISQAKPEQLKGGDNIKNKNIALDILNGKNGPQRDIVVLNSACALYASGRAKDIKEGIEVAKDSIDSKCALNKLMELKNFTNLENK